MANILRLQGGNTRPWGWSSMGTGPTKALVRFGGTRCRKMRRPDALGANSNYPPLGMDGAVTSNSGLALLSRITGA